MQKTLALLFAAALLTFSLTACGTDDTAPNTPSGSAANDSYVQDPVAGGTVPEDGVVTDGAVNSADPATYYNGTVTGDMANAGKRAANDVNNAAHRVANDVDNAVDRVAHDTDRLIRGASYNQMVRNASVHDTDGFLKDGENAMTPGIKH